MHMWKSEHEEKAKVELDRNIAHIYVILHRDHFTILSKGTNCEIIISTFAENAEMVVEENYIDVGNILTSLDFAF